MPLSNTDALFVLAAVALLFLALGFLLGASFSATRRYGGVDQARLTFHRPALGLVVVECRAKLRADQAEFLRAWLTKYLPEADKVTVVMLDPNERP